MPNDSQLTAEDQEGVVDRFTQSDAERPAQSRDRSAEQAILVTDPDVTELVQHLYALIVQSKAKFLQYAVECDRDPTLVKVGHYVASIILRQIGLNLSVMGEMTLSQSLIDRPPGVTLKPGLVLSWLEVCKGFMLEKFGGDCGTPSIPDRFETLALVRAGLLTRTLCDKDGTVIYSPEDADGPEIVSKIASDTLDRLYVQAARLNKIPLPPKALARSLPDSTEEDKAIVASASNENAGNGQSMPARTHADGTEGGCWLWWNGVRHDIPKGNVYKLVAFMWDRDSGAYSDLVGPVFDNEVEPQTVRSLANKANKALRPIGIPWRLTTDSVSRQITKKGTAPPTLRNP